MSIQTVFRSVQPFFHSVTSTQTARQTDHATCDICSNRVHLCTACMRCGLIIILQFEFILFLHDKIYTDFRGLRTNCDSAVARSFVVCRTDAVSCENQSTTTASSTISELPTTPPSDAGMRLTVGQAPDDEIWPPPPPPISELACVAATPVVSPDEESPETTPGSSTPVVRFTFTVKLDSQLLKRRRQQLDVEQASAATDIDDVDDDQTPSASPPSTRQSSSKPRPEMAVVIPDVVVCADAVDGKKHGVGGGGDERQSYQPSVHVVPTPTDAVAQQHRGCTESRSCQTDLGDVPAAQTCTCSYLKDSRTSAVDRGDEDDGSDDSDGDQLSCRCSSLLDDAVVDDDDGLWAQPEMGRSAVRVDDGSYLRPLVTRVYPVDKGDVPSRCGALPDGELTHMSWSEVLKEAETMGIPLHLPTTSTG